MRTLFAKLLIFSLLLVAPLSANIFWVAETVAADNVGTVNTYADPYGIQYAFTNVTCDDQIRIIDGADDYDSTSTSWTNRAADKAITAGTSCNVYQPISVTCWTDETTQNFGLGACELDFNTGTGYGISHVANHGWVYGNIGISNTSSDGFHSTAPDFTVLFRVKVDTAGGDGIVVNNSGSDAFRIVESEVTGSTGDGLDSDGSAAMIYGSSFHNNGGYGVDCAGCISVFKTVSYENTSGGFLIDRGGALIAGVVAYDNGGSGLIRGTNFTGAAILDSVFSEHTAYGLNVTADVYLIGRNQYYNNTSGARTIGGSTSIDLEPTPVTTEITYVDAANGDFEVTAGGTSSFTIPPLSDDTGVKGAVQTSGSGGGGGGSYASTQ